MSENNPSEAIKLTAFSHGGGCGCKISPAVLEKILAATPSALIPPQLLVGTESSDDAAVYQLNEEQAIVATTDFFTPIVDDPYDFGRIAATNALSDVYAMGGRPLFALAVVGMPLDKLPLPAIERILAGGAAICQEAGIPIAGGHSIDVLEPIYGLVALGVVHPRQLRRNRDARAGDLLILGKPLGIGILSAALKKGRLAPEDYATMVALTTRLNRVGTELAHLEGVHGLTDVTGFGFAGHLLEICRGAGLRAKVRFADLPLIPAAVALAQDGVATGASGRNWAAYGDQVRGADALPEWQRKLVTDPQTSGGLLVSCAPESREQVLACFHQAGFPEARVVGRLEAGSAGLDLEA